MIKIDQKRYENGLYQLDLWKNNHKYIQQAIFDGIDCGCRNCNCCDIGYACAILKMKLESIMDPERL